ncbi:hypothetical protein F5Y12DRAFT_717482 [Xylaria sp. FL1777]|nr:hypothetical protein F5Y12DRAFT_717482 [Xylaria sp. FL1777]
MSGDQFLPQYEPQAALLADYRRRGSQGKSAVLPDDWPQSIKSPMAWTAEDLQSHHVFQLTESEVQETMNWGCAYSGSGQGIDRVDKESAVLPQLQEKLAQIRQSLHDGPGLAVLRGLDPTGVSMKENLVIFAGVSSHISPRRAAQSGGKIITCPRPTEIPAWWVVGIISHIDTSVKLTQLHQPFHTDPAADVVAMYVLEPGMDGGNGIFSSVQTIYNRLAASDPGLLRELGQPNWPFDRPLDNQGEYCRRQIMFFGKSGEPEMMFSRGALIRSPYGSRPPGISDLTRVQSMALDALHFTATSTMCTLRYQKGDMIFFNNRCILHGREGFSNGLGTTHAKRHILRLWLRNEEMSGPPPAPLIESWEHALKRAGIGGENVIDKPDVTVDPCKL